MNKVDLTNVQGPFGLVAVPKKVFEDAVECIGSEKGKSLLLVLQAMAGGYKPDMAPVFMGSYNPTEAAFRDGIRVLHQMIIGLQKYKK